jgi:uncharacterized protein
MMTTTHIKAQLVLRQRPTNQSPVMYQTWKELLFLHWEMPISVLQAALPPSLEIDTFGGKAYVAIVPFFMRDIRPAYLPAVPGISNFMETNVRTYVRDKKGNPGVWFYSLDANQPLAVEIARRWYNLPYQHAKMNWDRLSSTEAIIYRTKRQHDQTKIVSTFQYQPIGEVFFAKEGTLEFFLAERYLLYAWDARHQQLLSGRVYHQPYPLVEANLKNWDSRLIELNNLPNPGREPDHVLYSPGVKVEVFATTRVENH